MKVTKSYVCIFTLAFVVGVTSIIFIQQAERSPIQLYPSEIVKENLRVVPQQPSIEKKIEPEFIEENNDWQNEDDSKFKVKLLEPGQVFHGDEINAKSGEIWLGLF